MKKMMVTWEINRPVLSAHEIVGDLVAFVPWLQKQTILLPITPAAAFTCTECGERQRLQYLSDQQGKAHAFIHCRECGPSAVDDSLLQRWEINSCRFLNAIFQPFQLSIREYVPRQLWQIGRVNLAGRSRDVWFVRRFQWDVVECVLGVLKTRPKAILFTPLVSSEVRWQALVPNLTVALESTLTTECEINISKVEERLADSEPAPKREKTPTKSKTKTKGKGRPSERPRHTELLRKELVKLLKSAYSYSLCHPDAEDTTPLLKELTKKKLGELVGIRPHHVTRCFKHESATELHGLWNLAKNPGQIHDWADIISKGME